jgi:hypothetical protein
MSQAYVMLRRKPVLVLSVVAFRELWQRMIRYRLHSLHCTCLHERNSWHAEVISWAGQTQGALAITASSFTTIRRPTRKVTRPSVRVNAVTRCTLATSTLVES